MKKCIRVFGAAMTAFCTVLWTVMLLTGANIPDRLRVTDGTDPVTAEYWELSTYSGHGSVAASSPRADGSYTAVAKLFGIFPLKTVAVETVDSPTVALCGTPFGIKMYIDGVLVVGLADVETAAGHINPAKSAGLKVGDVILAIDGTAVTTNEQVAAIIEQCGGKPVTLTVRRDGVEFDASFAPALSAAEGRYKAGLWVRDSSAGIGTLTFYIPDTCQFASLGHAVCDVDTGDVIPLGDGEIVPAKIFGIKKGAKGTPGELKGMFDGETIGHLSSNGEIGVFGVLSAPLPGCEIVPVKMKQETKVGPAQIYTTIDGNQPKYYDIEIKQVKYRDGSVTRNMVIEITDPALLKLTGGIVQGMSGSPILQDGALVGAVTHVFVGDPTKGYGIFAETMLDAAGNAQVSELKQAS